MKNILKLAAAIAVLATAVGCGGQEAATEPQPLPAGAAAPVIPEVYIKSQGQDVSAGGLCCWGHCNASGAFVKVNVTVNCRDRIVESCHNAGLAFNPNGDAWWGTCP